MKLLFAASILSVLLGGCAAPPANDFLVGNCAPTACTSAAGLPPKEPGSAWFGVSEQKRVAACLQTCAPDYGEINRWRGAGKWETARSDGAILARALDPTLNTNRKKP
ncbi:MULTISPECIES: hypothetical protein [unclassified Thiomonas]|uniref:hypothetical protein n=1 Tax=unclassified Thiomonas TaxID=2625466 RepID=UPI000A77059B|nr:MULTISPECIES: hypothetical protein [unclassified Thiomonas]VDY06746.1 exported protein of unknown function [Thiomonas sp. Bio17B3]VDY09960.1 exported protein of unknown function [Thiomonas sp. Sup16B3]VDY11203.1 exported protein of unknown function [Thiomonas sp. Sup16B3]VDY11257.1 exported protein of unknown function [Thiomonas sp. Bio17B3]VDY15019.1 exported protein of unknown function [Thiomonas sp. OC7]